MDRARYLRQHGVEGLHVDRLQALHVSVIGAGAVGNEVVKNLVLMGVGAVDVHDFDRVEIHNLTRSVFLRESDVGASKAAALVSRAAEVDPDVRLRAIEGDLWRTLTLGELARRSVVICAVDNLEARMRLSQLCLLAEVDLVNAGIDSRHASVELFRFAAPEPCACFECHLPHSAYSKVAERYSCGWLRRAMWAEDKVATTAITASVAGALAVQAALGVGQTAAAVSRRILFDTRSGASTVATLAPNPDCVACAPMWPRPRGVAARGDWARALAAHAGDASAVRLSDPLIFDYGCVACGSSAHAWRYVGRRADQFDDGITRCQDCGELGVRVDIRAEAAVDELHQRFGSTPLPVKFLLARPGEPGAVCIDLEE
jgi:molybdopterin/thiamine biosynthesis adenylyltransferase